jgi:hypothetical protein
MKLRVAGKLLAAAGLLLILIAYSRSQVDFVYTGF